eukprot:tig00000444_g798.t1
MPLTKRAGCPRWRRARSCSSWATGRRSSFAPPAASPSSSPALPPLASSTSGRICRAPAPSPPRPTPRSPPPSPPSRTRCARRGRPPARAGRAIARAAAGGSPLATAAGLLLEYPWVYVPAASGEGLAGPANCLSGVPLHVYSLSAELERGDGAGPARRAQVCQFSAPAELAPLREEEPAARELLERVARRASEAAGALPRWSAPRLSVEERTLPAVAL